MTHEYILQTHKRSINQETIKIFILNNVSQNLAMLPPLQKNPGSIHMSNNKMSIKNLVTCKYPHVTN